MSEGIIVLNVNFVQLVLLLILWIIMLQEKYDMDGSVERVNTFAVQMSMVYLANMQHCELCFHCMFKNISISCE